MGRPLVGEQTAAEYFKELVESALIRQHLQAGDLTEYYLVNLLCQYIRLDGRGDDGEPLAFRLARALDSGGSGWMWNGLPPVITAVIVVVVF